VSRYAIDNPDDCVFVERTLTQTVDRAELGYPDEWQFLVRRRSSGSEEQLVYYAATEDVGTEEFMSEYRNIVDQYRAANPTIPFEYETQHHRDGIHYDQRIQVPMTVGREGIRGRFYSNSVRAWISEDANAFKAETPEALLQAAIIDCADVTNEGELVRAVAIPWFDIMRELEKDPEFLFKIPWRKLEELIAGAYEREMWDEVILTPRSGDGGRDIIATKHGVGSIRIYDQVKAFAPKYKVTANDVRALLGVLSLQPNVSKGIITTTSSVAPGVFDEAAEFIPYRLELKEGDALRKWLIEVARDT
jgi:restriction system protein